MSAPAEYWTSYAGLKTDPPGARLVPSGWLRSLAWSSSTEAGRIGWSACSSGRRSAGCVSLWVGGEGDSSADGFASGDDSSGVALAGAAVVFVADAVVEAGWVLRGDPRVGAW